MATSNSTSHRFISGPIQRTIQAWQDFAMELPSGGPPSLSVNFVPASQGCFLVIQAKEQARGLTSRLSGSLASQHPDAILKNFCTRLGGN